MTEIVEQGTLQNYKRTDIVEAMRSSLDMMGATAAPDVCTVEFPPIFNNIFAELTKALFKDRGEDFFAVCLPRGHGKTITMKFMLLWAILFTDRRFIAVVCASEDLAVNLIADVWDMLESDNISGIFGSPSIETDQAKLKKFHFRGRDIILRAQGAGTSVRGLNIKMRRPDLFLCDDMQSKEIAESETLAIAQQKWFLGTLMKAKAPERCTFIYLGNMYPDIRIRGPVERYTCILRNLQINPTWMTWVVGAILADGRALWEEVRSLESLYTELEQDMSMGEESTFFAEVLNDPNATNNPIWDRSKVKEPYNEDFMGEPPVGRFIILDPSLGKKKSDDQIAGLFEWWDDVPVLVELRSFRMSAPDTVKGLVLWMIDANCKLLVAESVAYQSTVLQWFDFMCTLLGIEGLIAAPVSPGGRAKNSRIISAMKGVMGGSISLSWKVRPATFLQAQQFNPAKTDNKDDIWDVISYASEVLLDYAIESIIDEENPITVPGTDRIGELLVDDNAIIVDNSDNFIDLH